MVYRNSLISFAICLLFSAPAFAQSLFDVSNAFPNLSFSRLVDLQHAGDGTNRLFAVEQHTGSIYVFPNDSAASNASLFLDLDGINTTGEEGLLGLAFHPNYEDNGHFFVYYSVSSPLRSVVSRFTVDPSNPDLADPASELVIIEIEQPFENHNGGQLAFGPADGLLYIGLGDGGSGGDPRDHGENPKTLLGSILRIDVDNSTESEPYAIPADNPFVGNTEEWREEIFAYGFRNPWRFSFDPVTGNLWAGDVGQGAFEEIDLVEKGGNYGWDVMEGFSCFEPATGCDQNGLTLPVWDYDHDLGRSVTGGHVYREETISYLEGKYIYADFSSGIIWALTYEEGSPPQNEELLDAPFNISAFGVGEDGSFFICAYNGAIYRLTNPQRVSIEDDPLPPAFATLETNYPNPFRNHTTFSFLLTRSAQVDLAIFDVLGRRVATLENGILSGGRYTSIWDGLSSASQPAPAGVYFARLTVNDELVATRTLTMMK